MRERERRTDAVDARVTEAPVAFDPSRCREPRGPGVRRLGRLDVEDEVRVVLEGVTAEESAEVCDAQPTAGAESHRLTGSPAVGKRTLETRVDEIGGRGAQHLSVETTVAEPRVRGEPIEGRAVDDRSVEHGLQRQ